MLRRLSLVLVLCPLMAGSLLANERARQVANAMRQADTVVVGTVTAVQPAWKVNAWGDRLIVSRTWVRSQETLKGQAARDVAFELEGGTIDGVTLKVSDLPTLEAGERAVFMLKRNAHGAFVPHLRGAGILRLDANDSVRGLNLPLNEVRRLAREIR